ncbi:baseplate hub [Erwinia phage Cronus]|uniref:Baseplate hub subunit n=1 Tax=Erwinia phage Cronus TaxID=2163633 RepID=A0A2S1GLU2_9CAUD|nr:baseplate hub [Erwinia phage Cronus]AWD90350.1 baseplate hub subunit [Erwinia phage Cronus]
MFDYKFEIIVAGKTVSCRAFSLREYINLMKAKKDGTILQYVKELILKCTDAKDLNRQESEYLITQLWAHSLGEVNTQSTWECSCGHQMEVPLNLSQVQIDSLEPPVYNFGDFKIQFKYPKLFDDQNHARMIASCIDFIITGNERLSVDDLSAEELNQLYDAITIDDIKVITEQLLKPTVYLAVPIHCEKCGEKHVHIVKGLKEFFRLL